MTTAAVRTNLFAQKHAAGNRNIQLFYSATFSRRIRWTIFRTGGRHTL